ncbi:hypothetical protein CEY02_20230, partial [Bacillus pumilus]
TPEHRGCPLSASDLTTMTVTHPMTLVNRLGRLFGSHAAEQDAPHKTPAGDVLPGEPDCDVCGGS